MLLFKGLNMSRSNGPTHNDITPRPAMPAFPHTQAPPTTSEYLGRQNTGKAVWTRHAGTVPYSQNCEVE